MNLIDQLIGNETEAIKRDINTLSDEIAQLEAQMFDRSDLTYNSKAGKYQIARAKHITLLSARGYLEEEIALYEEAFSDELFEDINHIFQVYSIEPIISIIEKIINARLEIVRFVQSGISKKDYSRDMEALKKKINDVEQFAVTYPTILIPKQLPETISQLIYDLSEYRGISVNEKPSIISETAIEEIAKIISEKQRLPKRHKEFVRKLNIKMGWL